MVVRSSWLLSSDSEVVHEAALVSDALKDPLHSVTCSQSIIAPYKVPRSDPKIFYPSSIFPASVPKKVLIERYKREIYPSDTKQLIDQFKSELDLESSNSSLFHFEDFSTTDFDTKSNSEWAQSLSECQGTLDGICYANSTWESCVVLGFSDTTATVKTNLCTTPFSISNLFVFIFGEIPSKFIARLRFATTSQKLAIQALSESFILDSVTSDEALSFEESSRITKLARVKRVSGLEMNSLLQEVSIEKCKLQNNGMIDSFRYSLESSQNLNSRILHSISTPMQKLSLIHI